MDDVVVNRLIEAVARLEQRIVLLDDKFERLMSLLAEEESASEERPVVTLDGDTIDAAVSRTPNTSLD